MEKINIAELLKDCPKGMELDCTVFNNVKFQCVSNDKIWIEYIDSDNNKKVTHLTYYGGFKIKNIKTNCVIFPKGKTTWEGFHKPFVEGDVIYVDDFIAILSNITENGIVWYHCYYCTNPKIFRAQRDFGLGNIKDGEFRFATEEEKQKLFDAIKENGYKWNPETKTLEKLNTPRFKVGDRIKSIHNVFQYDIKELNDTHYTLVEVEDKFKYTAPIIEDKNWELVPKKFDITILKPYDKVLVRNSKGQSWIPAFFGRICRDNGYMTSFGWCQYCIPFKYNIHLLGTTNDCDDFYKTWEK